MRAYLDHASASPLRPEALEAMLPWLSAADPGRVHTEGRMVRAALEEAREQVAALFGTRPRQVVFTSGGTEAINSAVYGAMASGRGDHAVVPEVEQSSVRESSERWAASLTWVGVDGAGRVDPGEVASALRPDTAVVHCQLANQEVGTIQPLEHVMAVVGDAAPARGGPLVHVDATTAAVSLAIAFDALGVDLMSVSSAKLGGPRGAGALVVRRGLRVPPLLVGGAQERARRGGLENVAAMVGFGAAAASLWGGGLEREAASSRSLMERLRSAVLAVDGVRAFGPDDVAQRLGNLLCVGIDGVEAEAVLLGLDQAGVAAHSGSACSSELLEPSPVLAAMGVPAERSLRLSIGWSTTDQDIELVATALPGIIGRLRALGAAAG
ncbi:MAG: cysteine desulfurase family protein [Acidimicrobiales bacterium]